MTEEKSEKKENKLESLAGKCIVIEKREHSNSISYYDGNAGYHSDFSRAKIYNQNEIPDYIKNNPNKEIIPLDSERGLKLIVDEVKKLEHYIHIEKPRVRDAEENLNKLYHFDLVQKWVEKHNKWYHPLIGISSETENKILKEVARGNISENKPQIRLKRNPNTL